MTYNFADLKLFLIEQTNSHMDSIKCEKSGLTLKNEYFQDNEYIIYYFNNVETNSKLFVTNYANRYVVGLDWHTAFDDERHDVKLNDKTIAFLNTWFNMKSECRNVEEYNKILNLVMKVWNFENDIENKYEINDTTMIYNMFTVYCRSSHWNN